jgi:hypothetical protein
LFFIYRFCHEGKDQISYHERQENDLKNVEDAGRRRTRRITKKKGKRKDKNGLTGSYSFILIV